MELSNEWQPSKPGYISKTFRHGSASITIHRPILQEKERAARTQKTVDNLNHSLCDYLSRQK